MEFEKLSGRDLTDRKFQKGENKFRFLGRVVYHFSVVESTNKIATSLAEKGEREGAVVLADEQLSGEGRVGRGWFSPPGGLWFSLILRPNCSFDLLSVYPIMGAVAVARTIKKIFPSCPARVSWPNDVKVKEKKIAGVMCKMRVAGGKLKFSILGIGVNLNIEHFPSPLQDTATSVFLETRQLVFPSYFLDLLLDDLEVLYSFSKTNFPLFLDKIRESFPPIREKIQLAI